MSFIILDRDGVINFDSEHYIKSPAEWNAIPGSLEAIAQLNRAGWRVVIATNQSGIARGYYDHATLDCIHEKLLDELASVGGYIEEIFYCPHHPDDKCECRKPMPGMLHRIQEKYAINLADTYFVGDSYSDMKAAEASGCKPILVLTGNGEKSLTQHPELKAIPHFKNLNDAVEFLLCQ